MGYAGIFLINNSIVSRNYNLYTERIPEARKRDFLACTNPGDQSRLRRAYCFDRANVRISAFQSKTRDGEPAGVGPGPAGGFHNREIRGHGGRGRPDRAARSEISSAHLSAGRGVSCRRMHQRCRG